MSAKRRLSAPALHGPDYPLVLVIAALLAFGLIMVYSASVVTAYTSFRSQYYYLFKQSISAGVGLAAMVVLMRFDYQYLRLVSLPGLLASMGMLAMVLLPGLGTEAYGAQRWIQLFGFQVQPSEFTKVTLTIYMAHWLTEKREQVRDFAYGFIPFTILLAIVVGLLLKQPDMGTAFVIVLTATSVFFAAGAHPLQLAILVATVVIAVVPLIRFAPYRLERFLAFLDPWAKPLASGYHVVQALLAFGAGGLTGAGLGVGRQKFLYLPFPHTDSIFAVIGEELGLVGSVSVIALFLFFAYRGLRVSWYAPDQFGRLLAAGITFGIAFQAMINMGVLTSTLPFTGITLPFISYGGSSLITTLASCGVLLNISRQTVHPDARSQSNPRGYFWRRYRRPHLPGFGRGQRLAGRAG
ncbi:MAG: putative lipid II flippase FtsW [Chloroflexi bacterium]|nr:putative lipid II flippase FtsW [Chloroflexota bacterium]